MREEPLGKFLSLRLDLQQFYLLQITSTNRSISIVYLRAQLGIATLQMLARELLALFYHSKAIYSSRYCIWTVRKILLSRTGKRNIKAIYFLRY